MPNYDYKCPDCGFEFEKNVPMGKADTVSCPVCHWFADRQPCAPAVKVQGGTPRFYK